MMGVVDSWSPSRKATIFFGAIARKLSSIQSVSRSSGTASPGEKRDVTQPCLPMPYSVGEAKGFFSALLPLFGSFIDIDNSPFSEARNRNTFLFTLNAL